MRSVTTKAKKTAKRATAEGERDEPREGTASPAAPELPEAPESSDLDEGEAEGEPVAEDAPVQVEPVTEAEGEPEAEGKPGQSVNDAPGSVTAPPVGFFVSVWRWFMTDLEGR